MCCLVFSLLYMLIEFFRNESEEALISFAFESAWIDAMITSDYLLNEDIPHLFITIDPSAGKDRNLYVLCSTVFTRDGTCVVCFVLF